MFFSIVVYIWSVDIIVQNSSSMQLKPNSGDCVSIIQITDTHLFADSSLTFGDIVSEQSLKSVLEHARGSEHWPPDIILVTGDLAQEPVTATYQKLYRLYSTLGIPVVCLPGNHDKPEQMERYLNSGTVSTNQEIVIGSWCIVLLNSYKANTHAGELSKTELERLSDTLLKYRDKHVLIAIHHHPISIHSSWMDSMMLVNADDFLSLVQQQHNVKAVIFGHIHQAFHEQHAAIEFMGSPSTCVQFKPGASQYERDDLTAGYRFLSLSANGEIRTNVQRI